MASTPKVAIGIIYGSFEPEFVFSLLALKSWDDKNKKVLDHPGWLIAQAGTNLPQQRNTVVRAFLDTDAEWLLFIDTDHTYERLKRELDMWGKWVKPGGLIMMHDVTAYPEMARAALEYAEANHHSYKMRSGSNGLGVIEIKEEK